MLIVDFSEIFATGVKRRVESGAYAFEEYVSYFGIPLFTQLVCKTDAHGDAM